MGTERSREGEGEADEGGQGGGGQGRQRPTSQVKSREAGRGVENGRKKRVVPTVWTAGKRIRWSVLEVTLKTPGPLASADNSFGGFVRA